MLFRRRKHDKHRRRTVAISGQDFEDSIERIKATLLVHAIKSSPGGYKLSFEVTAWLGQNFEDAILPKSEKALAALIYEAADRYHRERATLHWYSNEPPPTKKEARTLAKRLREFMKNARQAFNRPRDAGR